MVTQKLLILLMVMALGLLSCSDAAKKEGQLCGHAGWKFYGNCEAGLVCVSKVSYYPGRCKAQTPQTPEAEKEDLPEDLPDSNSNCNDDQLECDGGTVCVDKENLCDGRQQCDDAADENDCDDNEKLEKHICEEQPDICNPPNGKCVADGGRGYVCACVKTCSGDNCEDCEDTNDPCGGDNPCKNGGKCYPSSNNSGYKCWCKSGYYGDKCENNPCADNPCQNGGECEVHTYWGTSYYKCKCQPGYYGKKCENKKHICDMDYRICNYPNGKCSREGDDYTCVCKDGCGGDHCEECKNHCDPDPCDNDGTCYSSKHSDSGYKCWCKYGYSGDKCEDREHICDLQPYIVCNYPRGKCKPDADGGDGYTCVCDDGCSGTKCEECDGDVDPCVDNPCLNDGKCEKVDNIRYKCLCRKGYYGKKCEHKKHWNWWG